MRGTSPEETAIDLVIEDHTRVGTAYFLMSEDNVEARPVAALGRASAPMRARLRPKASFLQIEPHPRAYGNFARFLGNYVRDEKVTTLQDAIRRLTALPAENWKLRDRGCLEARLLRRRRDVRSGDDRRPRDLRASRDSSRPACATSSSTACRC